MILKEIAIASFMGLRDLTIRPVAGVNLIEGENESGKSSLAAFLKFIFYGLSGSASKGELSERVKSLPWQGGPVAGSVTLTKDGRDYRVERQWIPYQKSFRETCRIIDLQSGAVFEKDPAKEFLGVPEEVFLHSVFHSGGELSPGGIAMQEAMENILFSADADLGRRKALKRLDDARVLLLHKNGKGGKLYALQRDAEALTERLTAANAAMTRIRALETDCNTQREKLQQDLAKLRLCEEQIVFTDATVRLAVLEKQRLAGENLERAKREEKDFLDSNGHNGFFPTKDYEGLLIQKEHEFFESERERAEAARTLAAEKNAEQKTVETRSAEDGEALLRKTGRLHTMGRTFCALSVLFLLLSTAAGCIYLGFLPDFAGFGAFTWLCAAGGSLLLGLFFLLLTLLRYRQRRRLLAAWDPAFRSEAALRESVENLRELEKDRLRRQTALDIGRAGLAAAKEKSLSILTELHRLAGKWGKQCRKADEIPLLLTQVREALAKAEELREAVLRRAAIAEAATEAANSAGDSPEEEARLRELLAGLPQGEPLPGEAYADCMKKCNFYKQTTEAFRKKLFEQEKQLTELRAGMEDPGELRQKLEVLRAEEARLGQIHDAYRLAFEKLEEASAALRERIAPTLSNGASAFLNAATEGKYTSLLVDPALTLHFTADGNLRESDYLSSGTRALSYLGLRLSLVKLLYKNCRPPLLFDESFACLDDRRFAAMLRGLRALLTDDGPTEQIFLLTSQTRDRAICERVFGDALRLHRMPEGDREH